MKQLLYLLISIGLISCQHQKDQAHTDKSGTYSGTFQYGNFATEISFTIEADSADFKVYFSSLEQNAMSIPVSEILHQGDSMSFALQSDFFRYEFKNKWISENQQLRGTLFIDTLTVSYTLVKEPASSSKNPKSEAVVFNSNDMTISGTIWYPTTSNDKALVIVTSSGNADRSASRAEAMLFAKAGFTVFHYDKRGTGSTKGNWQTAPMETLLSDDMAAIRFFSNKTEIPFHKIGIKGSSQGGTKVPFLLNALKDLKFGIAVSCPGSSLYQSDLNYWKNRNAALLGADLDEAAALQEQVMEFIAGIRTRKTLEIAIKANETQPWFQHIWIPNLDEIQTDSKLLFNPVPHFEKVAQPILIIQGTHDEIIPENSYKIIEEALRKAKNQGYEIQVLEGANHSMYQIGGSDFPYWSKLHPDYMIQIQKWIEALPDYN